MLLVTVSVLAAMVRLPSWRVLLAALSRPTPAVSRPTVIVPLLAVRSAFSRKLTFCWLPVPSPSLTRARMPAPPNLIVPAVPVFAVFRVRVLVPVSMM